MTVLLRVRRKGVERRCDARCYDAVRPECDCLCRGANHGRGLTTGLDNAWLRFVVCGSRIIDRADPQQELFAEET